MFRRTSLAALAAIGILAASAASAAPASNTATIPYGDLNLNTTAGAHAMLERITDAARFLCGVQPDAEQVERARAYDVCVVQVTDRAVARLGSARVSALASKAAATTLAANAGR